MTEGEELKGLGGWLILVGIGLVVGPILMALGLPELYQKVIGSGALRALAAPWSENFAPGMAVLLLFELLGNILLWLYTIWVAFLFFTRSYRFPESYIWLVSAALAFLTLDTAMAAWMFGMQLVRETVSLFDFAGSIISAAIWIPYMLVSERVRRTFVEGRADSDQALPAPGEEPETQL